MKKLILLSAMMLATPAFADYATGLGYFDNQQYPQAFAELKPLADNGSERAQFYIGYMYLNGYGVDQDEAQGLKYIQQSSDGGFEKAQSMMGYFLSEGHFVPQNKTKGFSLYQKAAEKNDDDALLNLGVAYYMGEAVDQDLDKSIEYLSRVNIVNKPIAGRYLADIYLLRNAKEDAQKAANAYRLAAANGDLTSFHSYARLQQEGKVGEANLPEAVKYYTYAASQNYAPSQYVLGSMYINGEGVPRDVFKGYAWISFAVNQNLQVAVDTQKKLEENMTLSDLNRARHEMVEIQRDIIGQVESPLKDAALRNGTVVINTGTTTNTRVEGVRRPRARRRR
ncbi:MAG: tetratricopeptide repeat protein [Pseudomonadota bacterium]|nr:tetratricopeptide repeat protein [Pseudomonadota bacterium]